MKQALIVVLLAVFACGQQPQVTGAPPQALQGYNSKWVNGVAPGYSPTCTVSNCGALSIHIGPGTCFDISSNRHTYTATDIVITGSSTTYFYLNNSCTVLTNNSGYGTNRPIATVTTSSSAVTGITDDRTYFNNVAPASATSNIAAYYLNSATGTALNKLAEWDTGDKVKTLTTADAIIGRYALLVGVCVASCGTTGAAQIQFGGTVNCVFDNTTGSTLNQGATVFASASNAGNCQIRAGGTVFPNENPEVNIVLGSVHETVASITSGTAYAVDLIPSPTKYTNLNTASPMLLAQPSGSTQSTMSIYGLSTLAPATALNPFLLAMGGSGTNGGGFGWVQGNGFSAMFLSNLGVSTHDINLDLIGYNGGIPPLEMFRVTGSTYHVPNYGVFNGSFNCSTGTGTTSSPCSVTGTIYGAQSLHFRVGGTGGVYTWLLAGNIVIPTPENDNPGHWLAFSIQQAAAGGPYTVTWPANFINPPTMTTTASGYTTTMCLYDGTNYSCMGGTGTGGSGTVTTFAAPSGSWPAWLVPTVTNPTTTPSLAVAATTQGNGSKVQLSTGTTTTNDCVKYDANGNTVDAGAACGTGGSSNYQTVQENGTAQTQRPTINLISGTGATVSCADNAGATKTDCTIAATGGSGATLGVRQYCQNNSGGSASITAKCALPVQTNDTMFVACGDWTGGGLSVTTPTDLLGNTFTAVGNTGANATDFNSQMWVYKTTSAKTGADSIKCPMASGHVDVNVIDYNSTLTVDTSNFGNVNNGSLGNTRTMTTTVTDMLLILILNADCNTDGFTGVTGYSPEILFASGFATTTTGSGNVPGAFDQFSVASGAQSVTVTGDATCGKPLHVAFIGAHT